jgi:hypothetical protein
VVFESELAGSNKLLFQIFPFGGILDPFERGFQGDDA